MGPSSPLAVLGGTACLLPMGHLVRIQYEPLTPATHPHMVLASSGDMPLEALATIADKVMEVASTSISSISVAPLTLEVGQLRSEVTQLREMIAALKIAPSNPHRGARSRSQSTSSASPRSSSPAPLPEENPLSASLYWYHRRFGDAACKCTSPCSWTGNGPAGC